MNQTCQLCSKSEFHKLLSVKQANFSTIISSYDIYKCKHCGLSVMHPFPTNYDIVELYIQKNIFSTPFNNPYKKSILFPLLEPLYRKYGADNRFIAQTSLKLLNNAETLLDIGCSTGEQLKHFLTLQPHIKAVGIDIDPKAKANAENSIQNRIIIDDFIKHDFKQHFDIITLKFVIEHLLDFRSYIDKIVNLLSPNGLFFLSTPDIDSPKAKQMKAHWFSINDPSYKIGHLRWFNRKSLYYLAETYGLKVLKIINRGELLYHLDIKLQNLLQNFFGKDKTGRKFIKYYAPRIIYSIIFDALLAQKFGYGEHTYVFMTKNGN